jgi:hypothetical protein
MRWVGNPSLAGAGQGPGQLIDQILERRGLASGPEREAFLQPKLSNLSAPEEIPGMAAATALLQRHLHAKSPMVIYSDYDVDGITSASVFRLFVEALGGGPVRHFIPDRKKEGYGLTAKGLERCLEGGAKPKLLVVLDCGTNSKAEVEKAKAAGIDVLIVDHHQIGEVAPGDALVNPQLGSTHHHLCTAGLVFKLCHAYLKSHGGREQFDLKTVLDLVALATVADLKSYLRIESVAEDALLALIMARAKSMLEMWTDTPITATSQTAVDRAESVDILVKSLVFPRRPAQVTAVVDANGATVPAGDYTVDNRSGMVYAKYGIAFPSGPYTLTANVGLSLRGDYAALEPMLNEAILDLAADLYQRRTPGAASENAGGTTIQWDASRETVARVMKTLRQLKLGVAQ